MKNIAIIPARSGSKGLKNKNIKKLLDKPLIAYSIKAALDSHQFSVVMVSTDSWQYAEIAHEYGAEVPFLRSEMTSSDTASSWDMVEEVLCEYEKLGRTFTTFCLLQPTSPMRTAEDLANAYKLYGEKQAIAVVSVCELEHPLAWCGTLGRDQSLNGFIARNQGGRRQEMEKFYRPNGAIYIADVKQFREDRFLYRKDAYAYIMPKERSVDIDTEFDFKFAEYLMLGNQQQEERSRQDMDSAFSGGRVSEIRNAERMYGGSTKDV